MLDEVRPYSLALCPRTASQKDPCPFRSHVRPNPNPKSNPNPDPPPTYACNPDSPVCRASTQARRAGMGTWIGARDLRVVADWMPRPLMPEADRGGHSASASPPL